MGVDVANSMKLVVTNAGRDALKNAAGNGTNALMIESVVLGNGRYTPDSGQSWIREEHHRLKTIAGTVTGSRSLHVTVRDESRDKYSVFEIGLVTSTGVLFAVYSQSDVIIEKASGSTLLLSLDIELTDINVKQIAFGDTSFINPAATTEMQGVVELATDDEARAAEDGRRAITPRAMGHVLDERFSQLGSASKHNEGDFERQGVAASLDDKLWKALVANYVAKSGGTYEGVINAPAPARGDRGSAVVNAWWCAQEFDVKGAADAVQQSLDKVNSEAWKGINGVWAKANDAQGRCGHLEYFLHGSDDRANVYVGDPTGDGILFKQEQGWWSFIYQHKTRMEVTPEGKINYATIGWGQVTDKYVVGEGDETGLVRMNGRQNIWDVNAKNYAASQYQARQAQETGVKAQQGVDSLRDIISKPYNDYLYLGGASDKVGGAIIKNEAGWLSSMLNNIATFQVNPDGLITKGSIDVSKVVNDYDSGPGYIKNKKTGLIIQFGFASNSNKNEVIQKFPLYFSSRNYVVVANDLGPGGGGNVWVDWKETGQCRIGENNSPNIYVQYIAIGY